MFGNFEKINKLEAENEELKKANENYERLYNGYKDLSFAGRTMKEWIKQRSDVEAEWYNANEKNKILQAENKLIEEFRERERVIRTERNNLQIENAGLKVRVEMLEKATEIAGEVLDVKELVNKLIDKMPEIKLENLSVNVKNESKESK